MSEEQLSNLEQQWKDYYLEYASYVVKDRAIPDVDDGLKPVQRRILHCMRKSDDGRFSKVAGIVGDTMHYHPHGDASIAGAMITLANKGYFIDRQGNFGNLLTGDSAAAPRYIECRLTSLAKETLYNDKLTRYVESYDGRSKEPVVLPCKVPVLLMQGTEGIAVGMATSVFPHNFIELLDAEIKVLENKPFQLYPDFAQGGIMDASGYDDGNGSIKIRARIEQNGNKVVITEIPAFTTTELLIESIEKASKANKVHIQSINDYTSSEACIEITPQRGTSADDLIKELYAYTDCEMSNKGTLRVICDGMPCIMSVSAVLRRNALKLVEITEGELKCELDALEASYHTKMLERIFVENKIYKQIETCKQLDEISNIVYAECERHKDKLRKPLLKKDTDALVQMPVRSISAYDFGKNNEELERTLKQIGEVEEKLKNSVGAAVGWLKSIRQKYARQFPRKTTIQQFNDIDAKAIAKRDVRVCYDEEQKLIGTSIRSKDAIQCTLYDKVLCIKKDGFAKVVGLVDKEYIGELAGFYVLNKEQLYSIVYQDNDSGYLYAKVFCIGQYTSNKDYRIIPGNSRLVWLAEGSSRKITIVLDKPNKRGNGSVEVDFSQKAFVRSRESRGVKVANYPLLEINVQ